jgi:hypothetical protein
MAVSPQPSKD